jgi:hypothetical protein
LPNSPKLVPPDLLLSDLQRLPAAHLDQMRPFFESAITGVGNKNVSPDALASVLGHVLLQDLLGAMPPPAPTRRFQDPPTVELFEEALFVSHRARTTDVRTEAPMARFSMQASAIFDHADRRGGAAEALAGAIRELSRGFLQQARRRALTICGQPRIDLVNPATGFGLELCARIELWGVPCESPNGPPNDPLLLATCAAAPETWLSWYGLSMKLAGNVAPDAMAKVSYCAHERTQFVASLVNAGVACVRVLDSQPLRGYPMPGGDIEYQNDRPVSADTRPLRYVLEPDPTSPHYGHVPEQVKQLWEQINGR